jgi:hypothetical protein
MTAQMTKGSFPITRDEHFVVLENPLELALEAWVVLHHQQRLFFST